MDDVYTEELVNCDGTSPAIISTDQCSIPLSTLIQAPYSLALGHTINAKLIAYNDYGTSLESSAGGGAVIVLVPDAPVSLANVPSLTRDNKIGLSWTDGPSNGGTVIIDYEVYYDQGGSTFVQVEDGITQRQSTTTGLTSGTTYKLKVRARNSVGYGPFSTEISILAAQVPDQIAEPTTAISSSNIAVSWSTPYDGGTSITGYMVEIRISDGVNYSEDTVNCDGTNEAIKLAAACTIPISTVRLAPYLLPWGSSIYARVYASNGIG